MGRISAQRRACLTRPNNRRIAQVQRSAGTDPGHAELWRILALRGDAHGSSRRLVHPEPYVVVRVETVDRRHILVGAASRLRGVSSVVGDISGAVELDRNGAFTR